MEDTQSDILHSGRDALNCSDPKGNEGQGELLSTQTNQQLRANPQWDLRLLDQVQTAVIATDMQGTITNWNRHAEKLYGWARDEVLGHSILEVAVGPADEALAHSIMDEVFTTGSWEGEFRVVRKDGTSFPAHVVDTVIRDDDGHPIGLVGVSIDITERKHLEEEHEKLLVQEREARAASDLAEKRATHILESITDAFFALDAEWRFLYVNTQAERLLERPAGALMGRSLWEEFPEAVGSTFYKEYHQALESQVPARFEEYYPPLGKWFSVRAYPAENGGLAIYFIDISERKRSEKALSFLASIVESSDDSIIGKAPDGTILSWNAGAERLYGYKAEEIIGRPISILLPPDRADDTGEIRNRLAAGERLDHLETVRTRKDGTQIAVSLTISPIKDMAGTIIGASSIARDISERHRAEEKLVSSESQFRAVFERSADALFVLDDRARIIDANPSACSLIGTTIELLVGATLTDFTDNDHRAPVEALWAHLLSHGEVAGEMRMEKLDGGRRDIEYSCMVNVLPGRHLAVIHDITERNADKAQLEEDAVAQMHLMQQLLIAEEAERRRLSMEIHDGPLQSLGVGLMALERARRRRERGEDELANGELEGLRGTLGGAVAELRAILGDLSLAVLESKGLEAALQGHVARYADIMDKHVELSYRVLVKLPGYLNLLFYRLAQEALANVRKHSQAEEVSITLETEGDELHMSITDDGVGFDVNSVLSQHDDGKHIGLRSMQERVRAVGGDIDIRSSLGAGTTLHFWCPVPTKEPTLVRLSDKLLEMKG